MRRRDFAVGLLLATAARTVRAQEPAKQHRIAIVIPSGPATRINDTLPRFYQPFFDELRRLGDVEGQNLTIERYSGEGATGPAHRFTLRCRLWSALVYAVGLSTR